MSKLRKIFPTVLFHKGFTLVEMLVVLGIVLLITMIILVKNQQFTNTLLLNSLAYDVALSVRQAQVYGLGAREAEEASGEFDQGYGIFFDSAVPTTYILYADIDGSENYDPDDDTIIDTYSLRNRYTIDRFCVTDGAVESCSNDNDIEEASVLFMRPDPDAIITSDTGSGHDSIEIWVRAPNNTERSISIESTGQISVN